MTALLERIYDRRPEEVTALFQSNSASSLSVWLEGLSESLTQLIRREPPVGDAADPPAPQRFPALLAGALRRHCPEKSDAQLLLLSELLVWTANGVLEGSMRQAGASPGDTRLGLMSAWRGILTGWGYKP